MTNYSVDSSIRRIIIEILFVISFLLIKPTNVIIMTIYNLIIEILPTTKEYFTLLSNIGISATEVSILSLFSIFYLLFCKLVWKIKFITILTGIPNLNGTWEGRLVSSHKNPETGKNVELDMTVSIKQNWNSISIRSQFPDSNSYSKTASLHINEQKGVVLGFSYRNDSLKVDINSREFSGYNELTYQNDTLEGVYFSNRNEGTHGTIKLKKSISR